MFTWTIFSLCLSLSLYSLSLSLSPSLSLSLSLSPLTLSLSRACTVYIDICLNLDFHQIWGEDMSTNYYEEKLEELNKRHYALIEELGVRHTDELQTLRNDYEVLLELAVKEKEKEMRNTIIEDSELEDLAGTTNQNSLFRSRDCSYQPIRDQYFLIRSYLCQVEELTEELKRKDRRVNELELIVSALRDETAILRQQATPQTPPTILIEDPDGEQRCADCDDKDRVIGKLREASNGGSGDESDSWRDERAELMQQLEHLKLERDEAKQMATAQTRSFHNSLCEKMGDVSKTIGELRGAREAIRGDLHRMRVEMEQYSAEISGTLSLRGGEVAPSSNISSQNHHQVQGPNNNDNASNGSHQNGSPAELSMKDKEIFELKVKMQDQQQKLLHMTKRLKEAREVLPVTIPSIEGVEGPEREKKLLEMVQQRDTELHQARRIHGQNLATIKRRHDKAQAAMQDRVEKLEMTIQQILSNKTDSAETRRRAKSMILPQTPGQHSPQLAEQIHRQKSEIVTFTKERERESKRKYL
eukprot:sb/3463788/